MRCHICDRVLEEPQYNKDLEAYEPCDPCLLVIFETVGSFEDRPYISEDELSVTTHLWEGVLTPPSRHQEHVDDDFA